MGKYYEFLLEEDTKYIFGKLDFELKSGVHIQYNHPEQEAYFLFIRKYFPSLYDYYKDIFGVVLDRGGEDLNTFYYLSFEGNNREQFHNVIFFLKSAF